MRITGGKKLKILLSFFVFSFFVFSLFIVFSTIVDSASCPSGYQCTDNAKNCRKYCKSLGKKVESMKTLEWSLSMKGMDKCCACKSMPQCPSGSQCTDNAKKCRKYCKSLGKKVESMTSLDCSLSLKGKDKCCKCKT